MRYRFAFLVPAVLFAVVAAVPAAAAPGGASQPAPAACFQVAPAAGSLAPLQLVTADPVPYCYDTKAACDNAQKQASGTKSACYYDKKKGKYCFDLYPPSVADPAPIDP